jgi:hypothetical protein
MSEESMVALVVILPLTWSLAYVLFRWGMKAVVEGDE